MWGAADQCLGSPSLGVHLQPLLTGVCYVMIGIEGEAGMARYHGLSSLSSFPPHFSPTTGVVRVGRWSGRTLLLLRKYLIEVLTVVAIFRYGSCSRRLDADGRLHLKYINRVGDDMEFEQNVQ